MNSAMLKKPVCKAKVNFTKPFFLVNGKMLEDRIIVSYIWYLPFDNGFYVEFTEIYSKVQSVQNIFAFSSIFFSFSSLFVVLTPHCICFHLTVEIHCTYLFRVSALLFH